MLVRNGTSQNEGKYKCICPAGYNGRDCDINMNQECERYGIHCKGNRVCVYLPTDRPTRPRGGDRDRRRDDDDDDEDEDEGRDRRRGGRRDEDDNDDDQDEDNKRRKREGKLDTNLKPIDSLLICYVKAVTELRHRHEHELYDHFRWAKSKNKVKRDDFFCACPEGYFPSSTRDKDSSCVSLDPCNERNRCKNGGICYTLQNGTYVEGTFRQGSYRCDCSATGYTGPDCEVSVNPCASNPCARENKVCKVKRNGGYKCECASGTFGTGCTLKTVNPCDLDDNKCSEDSQCINKHNATLTLSGRLVDAGKYTCRCDRGYLGKYCQYKKCVDSIVARRCQDDQVCVIENDEARCLDRRLVGDNGDNGRNNNDRGRDNGRRRDRDEDEDDEEDDEDEDRPRRRNRGRGGRGRGGSTRM